MRVIAREAAPVPPPVARPRPVPRHVPPPGTSLPRIEDPAPVPPPAPTRNAEPRPEAAPAPVPARTERAAAVTSAEVGRPVDAKPTDVHTNVEAPIAKGVAVAVVDTDSVVRTVLKDHVKSLRIEAVAYDSVGSLVRAPGSREPTVVVVGPSESPTVVVEHLEAFLRARPDCGAVMLLFDMSAEVVRSAFRAGVDDVVAVNADDAELVGAISRAVSRVRESLEVARPPTPFAPASSSGPRGRVVTVFGAKGGTGKSVVSINLAVALARQGAGPVVLVDANLQFGDVAIMLQLPPEHTIAEAVVAGDRLDGDLLGDLLLRHKSSGLMVLAAPPDPISGDRIGRAEFAHVLSILRERCAWVVVDTSPRLEESTLAALQAADDILMVTNLDVMSLKDARLGMQTIDVLGIQPSRVKLVLNQATNPVGLTQTDAERAMHTKVHTILPSDPAVAESVNRGVPAMFSAPTSKFALGIADLARSLRMRPPVPSPAPASATREHALSR